jgi:hypothetical protein
MIPGDFPAWEQVRYYYDIWTEVKSGTAVFSSSTAKAYLATGKDIAAAFDFSNWGLVMV